MSTDLRLVVDDLTDPAVVALVAEHHADMLAHSPEDSMHALDLDGLRDRAVTLLSAWRADDLVGIGAMARRDDRRAELKSMRVADRHRGTGAGRMLLRALLDHARAQGLTSVWLETGASDVFLPARRLYESEGFVVTGPFAPYVPDRHSAFYRLDL